VVELFTISGMLLLLLLLQGIGRSQALGLDVVVRTLFTIENHLNSASRFLC
jgi:hypothetical protein